MTDRLMPDFYAEDGKPDLLALAASDPKWIGAMGKATQGTYYYDQAWFNWFWQTMAKSPRYGTDWFAIAYHYFDVAFDPISQAHFYLTAIEKAGGWRHGDPFAVVDIERATQKQGITGPMVIDRMSRYVAEVKRLSGKKMVMYGGAYIRDLGIKDRMGCDYIWVADYNATLPMTKYTDIGFDLSTLFAWQGVGKNGDGSVDGNWKLPLTTPIGKADLSAITIAGGGDAAVALCKANCV